MSDLLAPLLNRVVAKPSLHNIVDIMLNGLPASTARTYLQSLRAFASLAGTDDYRRVASEWLCQDEVIRNRAAQAYVDAMAEAGIKPATVQTRLAALRRLLQTAVFHGVAAGALVVDKVPGVHHSFHGKDAGLDEIKQIRQRFGTHEHEARRLRDIAILGLMFPTGIRIGGDTGGRRTGILGMNRDDVCFEAGEIRIWLKGQIEPRQLKPDEETMGQILAWTQFRDSRVSDPALFVGIDRHGVPTQARLKQETFRNQLDAIDGCNPHAFRHAVGTQMIRAGMSVHDVRDQLGHTDIGSSNKYINYQDRAAATGERLRNLVDL